MKSVASAAFGWIVPGGSYLLMRRYAQFAGFAVVVTAMFAAGLALQGGVRPPNPQELAGLDGFTSLLFQLGALAKALAGAPYFVARLFDGGRPYLDGRLHEYGTTLLIMAGLCNVLAVSSALDLRKGNAR